MQTQPQREENLQRNNPPSDERNAAIEACFDLLSSGRPLSEVLTELKRIPRCHSDNAALAIELAKLQKDFDEVVPETAPPEPPICSNDGATLSGRCPAGENGRAIRRSIPMEISTCSLVWAHWVCSRRHLRLTHRHAGRLFARNDSCVGSATAARGILAAGQGSAGRSTQGYNPGHISRTDFGASGPWRCPHGIG